MKPLIVFVAVQDWANTAREAAAALESTGRYRARCVTLWKHPWYEEDEYDICVPAAFQKDMPDLHELMDLLRQADFIHLWNCEWQDFYGGGRYTSPDNKIMQPSLPGIIPIPVDKVKSCTFAGSVYRSHHEAINARVNQAGLEVVWEDPCFTFEDEINARFIPHAVNTTAINFVPIGMRKPNTLGGYNPGRSNYEQDVWFVADLVHRHFEGWQMAVPNGTLPHREFLQCISECQFFFQSFWPVTGSFGRTALEACAMGIPVFSFIRKDCKRWEMGGFADPAIISVTPGSFEDKFREALSGNYEDLCVRTRRWVEEFYGYRTVGNAYADMFDEIGGRP